MVKIPVYIEGEDSPFSWEGVEPGWYAMEVQDDVDAEDGYPETGDSVGPFGTLQEAQAACGT